MAETEITAEPEVADSTTDAAPVVDSPASGDETLDQLLAEFDRAVSNQPADPAAVQNEREIDIANRLNADAYRVQAEVDSRRAELDQQEQHLRDQENAQKEAEVLRTIRGNLDIDDRDLRSFVIGRALDDPSINQTWGTWRENPGALSRMVEKLSGELQQHVEQQRQKFLNQEAAADRLAVAQSLRGQGGKMPAEPPPDFGRMSDAEFTRWKHENLR